MKKKKLSFPQKNKLLIKQINNNNKLKKTSLLFHNYNNYLNLKLILQLKIIQYLQ